MISGYGFSHGKVVYTRAPTKKKKRYFRHTYQAKRASIIINFYIFKNRTVGESGKFLKMAKHINGQDFL